MSKNQTVNSPELTSEAENYDIICLSHLRWDFVYQRPQHLLSRFTKNGRVFYFEEPIFSDEATFLDVFEREHNLFVVVPHISHDDRENRDVSKIQREMLEKLIQTKELKDFVLWFYTPTAMEFASHLKLLATVFDCMVDLSAFKNAPKDLVENERRLLEKADLIFTGGQSLFEAKKDKHPRVFAFPSSIDVAHFGAARDITEEPADQKKVPFPKLGFCGVIDERMDIELLEQMADLRPTWQFVMIGPVVKIAEEGLPRRANIHYLGGKDYQDLPAYLSGWDIALMPFALNECTRFISPTKTPEYLAAGLPVISTPIRDVVNPYYEKNLVAIAQTADEFINAGEKILHNEDSTDRLNRADKFLSEMSWDKTWAEMNGLIKTEIAEKPKAAKKAV